ncbi:hypothetical protein A3K34_02020 [candidate division WWE3 bacterium RIFOXYC1_FULL_40_10]|uniref:Vitamin K epoxide reductase domain-containing protein n=1 Tax=candidate division WWE3 bacterium RIFOXYA2_FULL_46_9 TaxID=1802636 RepID=A0A1F4W0U7_UNCKA|nr:MAG: hypothetical protein A3K58_02020 [candidate division WWE3 bacterium RIFOXYB1_FULL_40_22]OGC61632.1 MAG: hypothetical protein A3K37_02020 [candidate division WWE3 bacterium RIFOXYA1_FULL_40_11]OGC62663.1 MAG: hypothetical protein A2264_02195 [candidate division WWE3 bacterium RIFOXYA2_FULL_46_9]OGC64691.1 MAG: hypothetical protein A2326_01425 [candidate division WWE3 bacterium RIFOXYB2_FULL_41_6]OGC66015.1 MAG: hypothetical protein A3K34_02020 [candidate division WWE3 bacterium RIFOXYC1_
MASLSILLIIIGFTDASYLLYKYITKSPIACPLKGDCNAVLDSEYSRLLGVKNEVWGFLYYGFLLCVILAQVLFPSLLLPTQKVIVLTSGFGVIYSTYLMYVMAFKISHWCAYCLTSALTTTAIFIVSLIALIG